MVRILDIENYAHENNIPIMEHDGIEFLIEVIKKNKIKKILEIGSAIGYSAIEMALIDDKIEVTTIERDIERYKTAVNNINDFNLNDRIDIIYGDALDIDIEGEFDLIFIDAAKSQYINFFLKFQKNLNKTGIIFTDNINFHGLREVNQESLSRNVRGIVRKINNYIEFLEENKDFKTEFINIGDGVAITRSIV